MGNTFGGDAGRNLLEDDDNSGLGPLGKGDPNDLTVRYEEEFISIPKYQAIAAENFKCLDTWKAFRECADTHIFSTYSCSKDFRIHSDCVHFWSRDPEYRNQIREEYISVRSEYRKTGRRRLKRALKGETYITVSQLKGFQLE